MVPPLAPSYEQGGLLDCPLGVFPVCITRHFSSPYKNDVLRCFAINANMASFSPKHAETPRTPFPLVPGSSCDHEFSAFQSIVLFLAV